MFTSISSVAAAQIETVKALLITNERLRQILASANTENPDDALTAASMEAIRIATPDLTEWRIYDHCAAVTRLYALFERYVEELLAGWLARVPRLWPKYSDLDEKLRIRHRTGIGKLLTELHRRRNRQLTVENVVRGLADGLSDSSDYVLLPEAFLARERNLQPDALREVFASVGIESIWSWMDNHGLTRAFIQDVRGDSSTIEGELKTFLEFRNDAAHGAVDEVLSTEALLQLADFIGLVVEVLHQAVMAHVVECCRNLGVASSCGRITEVFRKAGAVVAKVTNVRLRAGDIIALHGDVFCKFVTIQSIQLDGVSVAEVKVLEQREVGLVLGPDVRTNLEIFASLPP